jgi:hypothetical protein
MKSAKPEADWRLADSPGNFTLARKSVAWQAERLGPEASGKH